MISRNENIVITVAVDCYIWSGMSNSANSLTHSLCLNITYSFVVHIIDLSCFHFLLLFLA